MNFSKFFGLLKFVVEKYKQEEELEDEIYEFLTKTDICADELVE